MLPNESKHWAQQELFTRVACNAEEFHTSSNPLSIDASSVKEAFPKSNGNTAAGTETYYRLRVCRNGNRDNECCKYP